MEGSCRFFTAQSGRAIVKDELNHKGLLLNQWHMKVKMDRSNLISYVILLIIYLFLIKKKKHCYFFSLHPTVDLRQTSNRDFSETIYDLCKYGWRFWCLWNLKGATKTLMVKKSKTSVENISIQFSYCCKKPKSNNSYIRVFPR